MIDRAEETRRFQAKITDMAPLALFYVIRSPLARSLALVSLGGCDDRLCVRRPTLARQALIETKIGTAARILAE